jgi:hypothetical protein
MTLAQCVATDMSCPVRDRNIDRLKTIVQEARAQARRPMRVLVLNNRDRADGLA